MGTTHDEPTPDETRVTEVGKLADQTTNWDQVLLLRVRGRLAAQGLQLELHAVKAGWRWAIPGRDYDKRRTFGSLHLALQHADTCTSVWYQ